MGGETIAAILVAAGALIGGVFSGVRGLRGDAFNRDVQQSAALLQGYTGMVEDLRAQLVEVREVSRQDREDCAEGRRRLQERFEAQLAAERVAHTAEVERLRGRLDEEHALKVARLQARHAAEMAQLHGEIDGLTETLNRLLSRDNERGQR